MAADAPAVLAVEGDGMLIRLLINNLIVFGVYYGVGILTLLCYVFVTPCLEGQGKLGKSKNILLRYLLAHTFAAVFFGGLAVHYLSGRYFLYSTGNIFYDCVSFTLLFVLTVVLVCFYEIVSREVLRKPKSFFKILLIVFNSPSFFLGAFLEPFIKKNPDKLSLCITVLFYMLLQFIGIVTRAI